MTLREHLEAIRDAYTPFDGVTQHAKAALAILDEAEWENYRPSSGVRLVPDASRRAREAEAS